MRTRRWELVRKECRPKVGELVVFLIDYLGALDAEPKTEGAQSLAR
jgi:hypothetical protein